MPTLNRFPLLGLWAEEAARRLGYTADEAQSLGHAYAVLYAIRAQRSPRSAEPKKKEPAARPARKAGRTEKLRFGGDDLDVVYDADGKVRGKVGGDKPQTPRSYQSGVQKKFPPGYYDKLQKCFRELFRGMAPGTLKGGVVYDLYDHWKKECGVGGRVDLDKLLEWCRAARL